jgi:two-component system, NarL family, response regulator LiaR
MSLQRSESDQIHVMIVDPHAVVRRGLRAGLHECADLAVVGEAPGGGEALSACTAQQPDVVLMSVMGHGCDGIAVTRALRAACPTTQVLAIGQQYDAEVVYRAMAAGAIGYVLADAPTDELVEAVRMAAAGRPTLDLEATQALLRTVGHTPAALLTRREHEVLELLAEGLSNPEIARRLVISRSTAKFHVSSIMAKLGTNSRTETVALAIRQNLVRTT